MLENLPFCPRSVFRILHECQNRKRIFPYTALVWAVGFCNAEGMCLLRGTTGYLNIMSLISVFKRLNHRNVFRFPTDTHCNSPHRCCHHSHSDGYISGSCQCSAVCSHIGTGLTNKTLHCLQDNPLHPFDSDSRSSHHISSP